MSDILPHTSQFVRKQTKNGMITISQHQQPIASVRAGKGQPRFSCGRQVLQLSQR